MPEVRVDALTGLRTIVATDRATRPGGGLRAEPQPPIESGWEQVDPFLEGHEDQTPPEVAALRMGSSAPDTPGWLVRVVPNLYPALTLDAPAPGPDANPDLFTAAPATGEHEVIVNAPQAATTLLELGVEQLTRAMGMWRERTAHHMRAGAQCVHLLVNEGRVAGASRPHTHAQLYALGFVPAAIARERERFTAYATRTMGGNLLGDLVQEEVRRRERLVAYDDEAVCLAPYASRVPYQLLIAPRRPTPRFEDDGPLAAALLHDVLGRLAAVLGPRPPTPAASPPLNLWVRTAPAGADHFAWRIDVLPRLTHLAGLELGTGVNLNVVAPARVAAELRS
jgi:UDPglucose--hexose-1-phosphate uridylyltransferase